MGRWTETASAPLRLLAAGIAPTGDVARVRMTARDWSLLPDMAQRHGLTSVAAEAARLREDAPPRVVERLRAAAVVQRVSALQALAQLLTVLAAFDRENIAVLTLKGPVFSQWLYGDAGFRRPGDLDLLVDPEDRARALAVLQRLGFALPAGMSVKSAAAIYGRLGAWPLARAGAFPIDLHWRTAHARFPAPLSARTLIARSATISIGGRTVRIACATDAALLTLLHGAKHLWSSLEIVASIARLSRRDDLDWSAVRARATRARAWAGCALGLLLASEVLDAPVPATLSREEDAVRRSPLWTDALAMLGRPAADEYSRRLERRMHRASYDSRIDRWRYDVSRLLDPTPLDWHWCRLPDWLCAMYSPVRLARLAANGLRSVAQHAGVLENRMMDAAGIESPGRPT